MPRRHPKRPRHGSPIPHTRRLRVEPLEDRRMLATFVVDLLEDNTDDDGLTTLREAIALANATAEPDVIEFAEELFAEGARTLSLLEVGDTALGGSALAVTSSMTIVGPGAGLLTIDASSLDSTPDLDDGMGARLLRIDDALTNVRLDVSLSGMTLTGGDTPHSGGAIYSRENLTLTEMVIEENHSHRQEEVSVSGIGGGLYQSTGDLTVQASRIANNSAGLSGGGIYSQGAISRLLDSQLDGNVAIRYGGGIYHTGSQLHVSGSQITSNRVIGDETDARGGGIGALSGPLYMDDTLIDGNTAGNESSPAQGGGLYTGGIFQEIRNSTISNNRSFGSGGGAWLNVPRGVFEHISVSDNRATHDGGGIYLVFQSGSTSLAFQYNSIVRNTAFMGGGIAIVARDEATPRISDSVISTNHAYGSGGGIHIHAGESVTIDRSTIAYNLADVDETRNGMGDGIMLATGHLALNGSIVAANGLESSSAVQAAPDLGRGFTTTVAITHSLIGSNVGSGLTETPLGSPDSNGNIIGRGQNFRIGPQLAPLGKYGGRLEIHPLLANSPAIDAGNPADEAGAGTVPAFDLRGNPYTRVWSPEVVEPARIDMGSTEFQSYTGGTELIVDTLTDEEDEDLSSGDFSLREALAIANTHSGAFRILFSPTLEGGTIELELGELRIAGDAEIVGPGADLLTIQGYATRPDNSSGVGELRLIRIDDSSLSELSEVVISGLTLSGGYAPQSQGGAIWSRETLVLRDIVAANNHSSLGGAVYVFSASLTIEDSLFESNTVFEVGGNAPDRFNHLEGGAVFVRNSDLTVSDSIFRHNAADEGGAISATTGGKVNVSDSRFDHNSASTDGGGIALVSVTADIVRSLFTENTMVGAGLDGGGGAVYSRLSTLTIHSSTFRDNGSAAGTGSGRGGAVLAYGASQYNTIGIHFSVSDSVFERNFAKGDGGGINADRFDNLTIERTLFDSNQARWGGGTHLHGRTMMVKDSVFRNNSASLVGGGLSVPSPDSHSTTEVRIHIVDSTFADNVAGLGGGGLRAQGVDIAHSTFSGNVVTNGSGGAIRIEGGPPGPNPIEHSTIVGNQAGTAPAISSVATVVITHSVIARNKNLTDELVAPLTLNTLTLRNSFIDYNPTGNPYPESGLSSPDANGNFIGGPVGGPIDPLLGPLQYNGGPTPTHRPLPGSPLIDAGDPSFDASDPDGNPNTDDAILYDQRGEPFARLVDGANPRDVVIDIGAVEYNPALTPGDFNGDRVVDMADYLVWRNSLGMEVMPLAGADSSGNGVIDALDYLVWKSHYGEVYPEFPEEEEAIALAGSERDGPAALLLASSSDRRKAFCPGVRSDETNVASDSARDAALLLLAERPGRRAAFAESAAPDKREGDRESPDDRRDLFELTALVGLDDFLDD